MRQTIIDIVLLTLITTYIVDVSGFTNSWRSTLAKWLGTKEERLRRIKPFDCGTCMVWWVTIIYTLATGQFNLPCIAICAGASLLAFPIGQALTLIKELLLTIIGRLTGWMLR